MPDPKCLPPCLAGQSVPEAGHLCGGAAALCEDAGWGAGARPGLTQEPLRPAGWPLHSPLAWASLPQTALKISTPQHLALAHRTHCHLLFIPRRF